MVTITSLCCELALFACKMHNNDPLVYSFVILCDKTTQSYKIANVYNICPAIGFDQLPCPY